MVGWQRSWWGSEIHLESKENEKSMERQKWNEMNCDEWPNDDDSVDTSVGKNRETNCEYHHYMLKVSSGRTCWTRIKYRMPPYHGRILLAKTNFKLIKYTLNIFFKLIPNLFHLILYSLLKAIRLININNNINC